MIDKLSDKLSETEAREKNQESDLTVKTQLLQRRAIEVRKVEQNINKPVRGAHATKFARR